MRPCLQIPCVPMPWKSKMGPNTVARLRKEIRAQSLRCIERIACDNWGIEGVLQLEPVEDGKEQEGPSLEPLNRRTALLTSAIQTSTIRKYETINLYCFMIIKNMVLCYSSPSKLTKHLLNCTFDGVFFVRVIKIYNNKNGM